MLLRDVDVAGDRVERRARASKRQQVTEVDIGPDGLGEMFRNSERLEAVDQPFQSAKMVLIGTRLGHQGKTTPWSDSGCVALRASSIASRGPP